MNSEHPKICPTCNEALHTNYAPLSTYTYGHCERGHFSFAKYASYITQTFVCDPYVIETVEQENSGMYHGEMQERSWGRLTTLKKWSTKESNLHYSDMLSRLNLFR